MHENQKDKKCTRDDMNENVGEFSSAQMGEYSKGKSEGSAEDKMVSSDIATIKYIMLPKGNHNIPSPQCM